MYARLMPLVKWAWILVVLVAAGIVVWRTWDDIVDALAAASLPLIVGGVLLTLLAKLLLAENARIAAAKCGFPMGYVQAARLYNLSQLGKYLPGSIWQFVGRAAAYRQLGAGYAQIRDALLIESLWIVAGATTVGCVLTGRQVYPVLEEALSKGVAIWLIAAASSVLLVLLGLLVLKGAMVRRYFWLALPPVRLLLVQGAIWSVLGLSFWLLARACGMEISLLFAIGLFAAAYAVGFLVPFAPAGLGVRDAMLVVGLLGYGGAGEAVVVTVLARLVYLIVDLFMVAAQELLMLFPAVAKKVSGRT